MTAFMNQAGQPLLRVLCVMSTLDRGGAESMCMNLYRHINREKIQFDFVKHTSDKGAFEDEIISLGGRIFEAPRLKIKTVFKYISWWKKHLETHPEYRIIHGHFFGISPIYFRIAKKYDRKTIGHIHISKADRPIKAIFARFISSATDYPLACSQAAGKWVYGKRLFHVLNNAIDTQEYRVNSKAAQEVRSAFALEDCLVLGNVSRFNLQKNPYGTLEIFRLVHEKCPKSKLLWVGDGPMRPEIERKAKRLDILQDIVFTGVRSDVPRLLQAMDAFVFPSYYEGLGIAAVEAQTAGVETFCSSVIPAEVAVTDLCQFLPLTNYNVWAEAISKIPANSKHPDTMQQVIQAGYDIHDTAKWLEEFYLSIVSQGKR